MLPNSKKCVCCGYCCKKGPCTYGKTVGTSSKCIYLLRDSNKLGTWFCAKWDEMMKKEEGDILTMCGTGCSSTLFNDDRERVIQKIKEAAVERILK